MVQVMYVACFWHFFIVSQMDSVCGSRSRKEKLAANDHFNVYFLLNNSRQHKCWMAYRDPLPLKIAWWNYLFLSFACWTVCPVSALVQWKGIFLHNLWSIFLDQDNLVWTHLFPWWNFKPPWTCSGEWTRAKKAKRCRLKG